MVAVFALLALDHDSQGSIARHAQHQSTQSAINESAVDRAAEITAHYTRLLAFLTAVLAGVGILQFGGSVLQTYWLYRADKNADRTAALAEIQNALAGRQIDLVERQHGLAREQFYASHRPRMAIRGVTFVPYPEPGRGALAFSISNRGDTKGTITEISLNIYIREIPVVQRPLIPVGDVNIDIEPGVGKLMRFIVDDEIKTRVLDYFGKPQSIGNVPSIHLAVSCFTKTKLVVLGRVGIDRRFDAADWSFKRVPDSDFEYDD